MSNRISVQPNNYVVSELRALFQKVEMANVKKVKSAGHINDFVT